MAYKRIGFFFELSPDDAVAELNRLRRVDASPNEQKIVDYLRSGVDAGVTMIVQHDPLSDPPKQLGEAVLKCDGEWLWPESLAYFVEAYHIELPEEFVEAIRRNGWKIPSDASYVSEVPEGYIQM